ncbi:MAG: 50S ribosomal protein L9 [Alphaproteobacteria bacterium]|nr:50S ribosomal protein L9 [Alphaproteobacteria bacterium]
MEVILLERIERLGQMGDVVSVKPGYARNFLLPQKKALRASKENLAFFESQRAQLEAQNLERKSEAESVSGKLDSLQVVLVRQAGESGQLYGSVTARDIADAVKDAGFTISRDQVLIDRPIKMLGLHPITVRLHPEVSVTVITNVAKSQEEAQMQARGERPGGAEEAESVEEAVTDVFEEGVPEEVLETAVEAAEGGPEAEAVSEEGAAPVSAEDKETAPNTT